jgi:hypothetical protein
MTATNPGIPERPVIDAATRKRLIADDERFRGAPLTADIGAYVRERYGVELASRYGCLPVRNAFGKASGQLSLQTSQVETDAAAGLGFVVLKTLIAVDARGNQTMKAWAIPETKMVPERIAGSNGTPGWTVTWKGRGWSGTLDEYLTLFRESLAVGVQTGLLVIPSCKYHLPEPEESIWRIEEYHHTTRRLLEVWEEVIGADAPMPLEKDFSPTLAGDDRSRQKETILRWLRDVPRLIRQASGSDASGRPRALVGLKLMNAMFDDDFQLDMIREAQGADWLVYANRLFDPNRVFEGKRGVAYGGPDLSRRNLRVLRLALERNRREGHTRTVPISATGDILTGRRAVEYALVGATSFQMHTLFQLPLAEFAATVGSRTSRGLHRLLFDPVTGFIAWMCHFKERFGRAEAYSIERLFEDVNRTESANRV